MIKFVLAAAVAVIVVLALLLRPLLWKARGAGASRRQLNMTLYKDDLAKLEQDHADKLIDEAVYQQAQAEMRHRLLEETADEEVAATPARSRWTVGLVSLAVPLVAAGIYLAIGTPGQIDGSAAAPQVTQKDIEQMVAGLAAKMEQDPGNLKGWAMLARSYKVLKKPMEAERAFERAGAYLDTDAQALADYADVVATNAGGNFAGKPIALIDKALKVDPDNVMALWLAGTAAFTLNDYDKTIRLWEKLATLLPADSDDARSIQASIAEVRAKSGRPALAAVPAAPAAASPVTAAAASPANPHTAKPGKAGASVSGVVELDRALSDKAKPGDTILVIARAPGVRMPVAVVRAKAAELPFKFVLDDSVSMRPEAGISSLTEVSVEARISKSGLAMPEPGDLISTPQIVKVGASGVQLRVAQVRP